MLPKPPACVGCPLYQTGQGFVPDENIEGAQVYVLAQNPGEQEEKEGKPKVGKVGQEEFSMFRRPARFILVPYATLFSR